MANLDSINYSFGFSEPTRQIDTVFLWLRIIGVAENRDREVNIVSKETSTAKRGYHYEFGPLVIPANEYEALIPVYLFKSQGLGTVLYYWTSVSVNQKISNRAIQTLVLHGIALTGYHIEFTLRIN